jgi:hypothetical protein
VFQHDIPISKETALTQKPVDFPSPPGIPPKVPFRSLRALLLSARLASKILSPEAPKISLAKNQELTRGLFKRLDGVIAYPKEITNPRLPLGADQAALQLLRARYG